jgi:hypothetical protein
MTFEIWYQDENDAAGLYITTADDEAEAVRDFEEAHGFTVLAYSKGPEDCVMHVEEYEVHSAAGSLVG